MIDYIALTIGHGLLAFAFWHLFLRAGVDVDPLLDEIQTAERANRKITSTAGRNAARRAGDARSSSVSDSAEGNPRSSSVSDSAEKNT